MSEPVCPRCSRKAFSNWRKLGIGPLKRVPCESCGVLLSAAWVPSIIAIVLASFSPVIGIVAAISIYSGPMTFKVAIAGLVASAVIASLPFAWLYARFVPLVARDV